MGPYASSPTFQSTSSSQSSPVKYCKVSERVCLPFHETFSSLSALQCPSAGCGETGGVFGARSCSCGKRGGGGDVISMDVENEGGGEGQARPPSPPHKPLSQYRREEREESRHPQVHQPSVNGHSSPFYEDVFTLPIRSRESINGNHAPPLSPEQHKHRHKPLRQQPSLTSSSSSPHMSATTDLRKNPQRCKENISKAPPILTLTHDSPDLSHVHVNSSPHQDTKKVHSPSFFPQKFTLPPCDALVSPTSSPFALSPNPSLLTMGCASSSVPSIPSKLSRPSSREHLFSTASASSSAINIPGMSVAPGSPLHHVDNCSSSRALGGPASPFAPPASTSSPAATNNSSPSMLSKSLPSPAANFLLLKSKPRGLLERRGSNQSLTLNISSENFEPDSSTFSPSFKSDVFNVEEYLVTTSRRLSRKELRNAIKNNKNVAEEFWSIPMNLPDRVDVSGSSTKNRYQSIIPNPKTRVNLQPTPPPHSQLAPPQSQFPVSLPLTQSSPSNSAENLHRPSTENYINANYVEGQGGEKRAFIATQGPMEHTIPDFWRMVWKERSPIIVMITKLKERNKSKCELYLPVLSSSRFGDFIVSVDKIEQREGYQLRMLTVTLDGNEEDVESAEKKMRPLTCTHCWFTSWPDHKAPQNPKPLLDMIYFVEENRRDHKTRIPHGPVVVHCSAGIGRTGCFIAISLGVQQLIKENCVDILRIVCRLRKDRGGMIQTSEQYEFIYLALAAFEKTMQSSPPLIASNGDGNHPDFNSFMARINPKSMAQIYGHEQYISSPKSAPLPPY